MNICSANKDVDVLVGQFIKNVSQIKEESITDYLVWQWKILDARFNYIKVNPFTKEQENKTTGADFEMELWIVGKDHAIPLVFQAKKLMKEYNSYKSAINYPDNTKMQIGTLLAYARTTRKLPFYMFYSVPNAKTKTMCKGPSHGSSGAVYMADALAVQVIANSSAAKISKNHLLSKSNPFYCLFCCPLGAKENVDGASKLAGLRSYFELYFPLLAGMPLLDTYSVPISELNPTVKSLLEGRTPDVAPDLPYRIVATLNIGAPLN